MAKITLNPATSVAFYAALGADKLLSASATASEQLAELHNESFRRRKKAALKAKEPAPKRTAPPLALVGSLIGNLVAKPATDAAAAYRINPVFASDGKLARLTSAEAAAAKAANVEVAKQILDAANGVSVSVRVGRLNKDGSWSWRASIGAARRHEATASAPAPAAPASPAARRKPRK